MAPRGVVRLRKGEELLCDLTPAVPLELGADGEGVVGHTVVAPGPRTRNELSAVWGRTPLLRTKSEKW